MRLRWFRLFLFVSGFVEIVFIVLTIPKSVDISKILSFMPEGSTEYSAKIPCWFIMFFLAALRFLLATNVKNDALHVLAILVHIGEAAFFVPSIMLLGTRNVVQGGILVFQALVYVGGYALHRRAEFLKDPANITISRPLQPIHRTIYSSAEQPKTD